MTEPPEDHTDLDAVAEWASETVDMLEEKRARHIMIPITMMRTLLAHNPAHPDCALCAEWAEIRKSERR